MSNRKQACDGEQCRSHTSHDRSCLGRGVTAVTRRFGEAHVGHIGEEDRSDHDKGHETQGCEGIRSLLRKAKRNPDADQYEGGVGELEGVPAIQGELPPTSPELVPREEKAGHQEHCAQPREGEHDPMLCCCPPHGATVSLGKENAVQSVG